mmetsp:Transcript_4119/g.9598  ORF Transcript_4119/g.9598 Transcript_4119/m.9598 type:complete len:86 (+) Transcript_4119:97-354(+)
MYNLYNMCIIYNIFIYNLYIAPPHLTPAGTQGNIQLFRNETDLGVYPYTSVKNLEGYMFAFDSDVLSFPITPFVADSIANTALLV